MTVQIVLGLAIIVLSVVIQTIFIELAARGLKRKFAASTPIRVNFSKFVLTLSAVTLWLLIGLLMVVSLWSLVFVLVGVFPTIEESFYFSLVAFTTLGFGDVIVPIEWRILAGFIATNGFLLFGLNTAVLLEVMLRLRSENVR